MSVRTSVVRLSIGGLGLVSSALAQQTLYIEVTDTHLPSGIAGRCMDAAAGDADGDGDLDLALAMEFEPNILLLNDGAGRFSDGSGRLPRAVHDSEDVAFADFDGDGDLDVVVANEAQNQLYLNDGGRLVDATDGRMPVRNDETREIKAADVEGDGDIDILAPSSVVRRGAGNYRVLLNDGGGQFSIAGAGSVLPAATDGNGFDIEVADFNSDGQEDLFLCNRSSAPRPDASITSGGQPRLLLRDPLTAD